MTLRGIFPAGQTSPNWDEFLKELKSKFMPEFEQWNMQGDWPGYHSVVQAYKLCLDSSLHPALMVNVIKALDPYLRRKVIKEPRPTSFDAAVARTWEGFRAADLLPRKKYRAEKYRYHGKMPCSL